MNQHNTRDSSHPAFRLFITFKSIFKINITVCAILFLLFMHSGCSTLLHTKDEDKISVITELIPNLPLKKQQNTDIAISEKGRNSKAMQWLRSSIKSIEKAKWSEAITAADVAISIEPTLYDAYTMRGLAYLMRGLIDRTISDCNEAINLNSRSALAYACRGTAYMRKEGITSHGQADMDQAKALTNVLSGHVSSQDREDEVATFAAGCITGITLGCTQHKKMVGYFPSPTQKRLTALVNESYKLFIAKDWDGVIIKTSQALLIDEGNLMALCNRSGAYANKGMVQEAAVDATSAVSANPAYPLAYNNRGWVRELTSQWDDALIDYETACAKGLKIGCVNASRLRTQKGLK
jgi:tetratricopeptide (TPR) repeat protein